MGIPDGSRHAWLSESVRPRAEIARCWRRQKLQTGQSDQRISSQCLPINREIATGRSGEIFTTFHFLPQATCDDERGKRIERWVAAFITSKQAFKCSGSIDAYRDCCEICVQTSLKVYVCGRECLVDAIFRNEARWNARITEYAFDLLCNDLWEIRRSCWMCALADYWRSQSRAS